jgi:hypothetical protein
LVFGGSDDDPIGGSKLQDARGAMLDQQSARVKEQLRTLLDDARDG